MPPESVTTDYKVYGKSIALPGIFDFANRNGTLFEWNEEVDEFPKGSSKLRTSSSTLPSLRNIQEWCSGEINPFH